MSNILARCTAVGIVAGGFALTGDLGFLADRGRKVLSASDVPAASTTTEGPAPTAVDTGLLPAVPEPAAPAPVSATGDHAPPPSPSESGDDELVRGRDFLPSSPGVALVDIATLPAGGRIVAWLRAPRGTAGRGYRCLVFDLVDPATGEALAYEAVSFAADGQPKATAVPPSRVRIGGSGPRAEIVAGGMIAVERRGIADGGFRETIGPVASLDVIR